MDSATTMVEQEPTLREYLDIALDRWWLIAAITVAALIVSLVFSLVSPPVFRGTATVMVDRSGASFGLVSDITGFSQQTFVDTLAEIVKSRSVAEAALDRLGTPVAEKEEALKRLQKGLTVQRVRNADIIRIQADGLTPEAAAATANAVAAAFLAWHVDARRSQAAAGREFMEGQLATVGQELRTAEDALAAYKTQGSQVSLSEQTSAVVAKLADFEGQRRAVVAEGQAVEASLRQAQLALSQQAPMVPASSVMSEDPAAAKIREQLSTLEVELAGLREQFTERHAQVVAAKAKIEKIKAQLRQLAAQRLVSQTISPNPLYRDLASQVIRLEVDRRALMAREAALVGIVQRYARDAQQLPAREAALARLTRDVKVAEQTYLLLSEKLQEARISEASIVGDLRVVDGAMAPSASAKPRTVTILLGVLLGLMVGVGAVYTLESFNTTFKNSEDVGKHLGLPVLATIPLWKDAQKLKGRGEIPLITGEHRRIPFAEAFRHLRTSLLYLSPDRPLRKIQITSPGPGEGKTTVAANLAVAFSQMDKKVWLVECDLRRPRMALAFQPKTDFGLSELLVDGLPLEQAVHKTAVENLWFMPSGRTPPNPAELLGSRKMRAFLSGELDGAELLVMDAAPVLPVTDAAVLAPAVDGVVLVVDLRRTHRDAARRAIHQLETVGTRVLGIVVNGVPTARGGFGYYYSDYYDHNDSEKMKTRSQMSAR